MPFIANRGARKRVHRRHRTSVSSVAPGGKPSVSDLPVRSSPSEDDKSEDESASINTADQTRPGSVVSIVSDTALKKARSNMFQVIGSVLLSKNKVQPI